MANEHFNGGKMTHIFNTNRDSDSGELIYIPDQFTSPEASSAFKHGELFFKIDGANGMVITNAEGHPTLYQRYDDKKGKIDPTQLPADLISLPPGANPDTYTSPHSASAGGASAGGTEASAGGASAGGTEASAGGAGASSSASSASLPPSHHYYYRLMDPKAKGKPGKITRSLYEQLATITLEPDQHYSVELVGRKFQQTPGVDQDASIAFHRHQIATPPGLMGTDGVRTFERVHQYLRTVKVEGLIVKHQGKYFKIRSAMMPGGPATCPFSRHQMKKPIDGDDQLPLIVPKLL